MPSPDSAEKTPSLQNEKSVAASMEGKSGMGIMRFDPPAIHSSARPTIEVNEHAESEKSTEIIKPFQLHSVLQLRTDLHASKLFSNTPVQMHTAFSLNHHAAHTAGIVQRSLGADGYSMPDDENTLDDFLEANGFANPFPCSAADYLLLQADFVALRAMIGEDETVELESAEGLAYQALIDRANGMELSAGFAGWIAAVTTASDNYEAAPGAGDLAAKNAAALAAWPGRLVMPPAFSAAVVQELQNRLAARLAAIAAAYQAYVNNGRLLQGTIIAIQNALPAGADLATVNARLAVVYVRQCTVARQNWLMHLGIAGNNINGNANVHYTTFNDSVAADADIAGLRVDQNNRNALCAELFVNHTGHWRQLHATVVTPDGVHHHRYWSGHYSAGVPPATIAPLDAEYNRMRNAIHGLVTAAINAHGRVAHNAIAQQLGVGP
jgi:hypothetical protein